MSSTATRRPSRKTRNASRRRAKYADRDENGRFKPRFARPTLYKIVFEVSLLAASLEPDRFPRPSMVSERRFNKARFYLRDKWGEIPQAHAICKLLRDVDGKPWEWRELLEAVHDPTRDINAVDAARLAARATTMDDQRLEYAALRIAYLNRTPVLRSDDYANGRNELLRGITRRSASEAIWFAKLLPTEGQMVHYAGSWEQLGQTVGLAPTTGRTPPVNAEGVPRGLAIALYYARHGVLPLKHELEDFARERFALAREREKPWLPDAIDEGLNEIRALGLPKPPRFEVRINRDWQPITVDVGELSPPAEGERKMVDILSWVRKFLDDESRGGKTGQAVWRRFAAKHLGAPSWDALARRGGLNYLIEQASRPDSEEWARGIDEARPVRTPKARPRSAPTPKTPELERLARHENAEKIIAALRKSKREMTAKELATAINLGDRSIRTYVRALLAYERIDQARKVFDGNRTTIAYRLPQSPT